MSCRLAWCRAAGEHGAHWADGPAVGGVSLLYLQSDVDGQPVVRVSYPAGNRGRLDLTPQLAADLADMLDAIDGQAGLLSEALSEAARTLGGAA
jgi:hypothetical protein